MGAGEGGVIGDLVGERDGADAAAVLDRGGAFGGVEDQRDIAILEPVDHGPAALVDLVDHFGLEPLLVQPCGGAGGGADGHAEIGDDPGGLAQHVVLIVILDREEHHAGDGQVDPGAHLGLEEGAVE